jgi:isopenicillin N synthase-like dioxygenase
MSLSHSRETLPILDLSRFESDRENFLADLRAAAWGHGFFYLAGHEVDPTLIDEVLRLSRRFFALPEKDKLSIEMVNSPHFRGYNRAGFEHARGKPDWREQHDVVSERDPLPITPNSPPWARL